MKRIALIALCCTLLTACGGSGGSSGGSGGGYTPPTGTTTTGGGATPTQTPTPTPTTNPNIISTLAVTESGTLTPGTPGSITISAIGYDANGKVISGSYATPVTLSVLDYSTSTCSGCGLSTVLSTPTLRSSSQTATLTYNGLGDIESVSISASSGSITSPTVNLGSPGCADGDGIAGYEPCDIWAAYALPSASAGAGQTIAVVDAYDDPNAESDLAYYRSTFGLPACTSANGCFEKVGETGSTTSLPSADMSWSGETSLDLDAVSAACPLCHIILVEANSTLSGDFYAASNEAAVLGANVVSNSWSSDEYSGETGADSYFDHPGVAYVFSAGDNAYAEGTQYPAASPYVTAAGGTTLLPEPQAMNGRFWSEGVWYDYSTGKGTGSGCSAYEPKPTWQTDTGCPMRMGNDLAADGDPDTGLAVYNTYVTSYPGWYVAGGTSLSAPLIAGMYALAGNAATIVGASYAYQNTTGLWPITIGSNATSCSPAYFCTAGTGYNGPGGMGAPNGLGGTMASMSASRAASRHIRTDISLPGKGAATQPAACNAPPASGHVRCEAIIVLHVAQPHFARPLITQSKNSAAIKLSHGFEIIRKIR